MKVHLSDRLVAALRAEYRCLPTSEAVSDMAESIIAQHLLMVGRTRRAIDESRMVPAADLAPEPIRST